MNLMLLLLCAMIIVSITAIYARDLFFGVVSLALMSVLLSAVLFQFGAPFAAVFELSVCAGFITVIFISTISLTKPMTPKEIKDATVNRFKRYWPLPIVLVGAVALFMQMVNRVSIYPLSKPSVYWAVQDVKKVMWELRSSDMLGQLLIILVGIMAVVILFKEKKEKEKETKDVKKGGQNG